MWVTACAECWRRLLAGLDGEGHEAVPRWTRVGGLRDNVGRVRVRQLRKEAARARAHACVQAVRLRSVSSVPSRLRPRLHPSLPRPVRLSSVRSGLVRRTSLQRRCLHVSPGLALWLCGASRAPSAASPQLPRPRARYFRAGQERVAPRTARPRAMPCSHVASVPCTCRDLHKRGPSAISAVDVAPMPSAARPARRGRFGSSVRDLRG